MNYFSWGGTNRPVPGDSVGARSQRYMIKSYRGFYDATFPIVGDHLYLSKLNTTNEGQRAGPPDYISHMGAGAVFDTKFRTARYNSLSGNGEFTTNQDMLYPGQAGYTTITGTGTPGTVNRTFRWGDFIKYFGLYNDLLISKAEFMNLYKYGFDYPEAYAFKVDESNFIHSFYATTNQVSSGFKSGLVNDPWGSAYYSANRYTNGSIELRGLKPFTDYYITNVEDGQQWAAPSDGDGNIVLEGISFATGIILKTSEVQTASIYGKVIGVSGATVPGAELKLLNTDGTPVAGVSPTAANLDGFYCFPLVPAGEYVIKATANKGSNGLPYPGVAVANTYDFISIPFNVTVGEVVKDYDLTDVRIAVTYFSNDETEAAAIDYGYAGKDYTALAADFFPAIGKEFVEWNTEADGSGDIYAAEEVFVLGADDMELYATWRWATVTAWVNKLNGNKNELYITVTEHSTSEAYCRDITKMFMIDNNAAGTYTVERYSVYVDTKGNTQIRDCRIVAIAPIG